MNLAIAISHVLALVPRDEILTLVNVLFDAGSNREDVTEAVADALDAAVDWRVLGIDPALAAWIDANDDMLWLALAEVYVASVYGYFSEEKMAKRKAKRKARQAARKARRAARKAASINAADLALEL